MHQPSLEANGGGATQSRRDFLVTCAGGLSIGFFLGGGSTRLLGAAPALAADVQINSYVKIASDGLITLLYGGSEMGQGAMSGLAQILAEELMVDWEQIGVEQADAGAISYLTGGSTAVRQRYMPLRKAGATARELLVSAAMLATGDRTRDNYRAASGRVTYTGTAQVGVSDWSYADLAASAASAEAQALLPATIPLTDPASFRLIGKPLIRVDLVNKVTGAAKYGIDVWFPDMVFGVIKHCPTIGGVLAKTPLPTAGAATLKPDVSASKAPPLAA